MNLSICVTIYYLSPCNPNIHNVSITLRYYAINFAICIMLFVLTIQDICPHIRSSNFLFT